MDIPVITNIDLKTIILLTPFVSEFRQVMLAKPVVCSFVYCVRLTNIHRTNQLDQLTGFVSKYAVIERAVEFNTLVLFSSSNKLVSNLKESVRSKSRNYHHKLFQLKEKTLRHTTLF